MLFWRQAAQPKSIVVGRRCLSRAKLLVLLRSWHAAVTRDTGFCRSIVAAPPGSYDLNAAFKSLLLHDRGIHALRPGTGGAGVTGARFRASATPCGAAAPA